MHYDEDKLIEAIWSNPNAITGLNWTMAGNKWQAQQYPDGTDGGGRRDRTTLKRGTKNGKPVIWVNCNGDFGAFQDGTIWGYLRWLYNTNDYIDILQLIGETYGITPDYSGYSREQIERAQQRRSEKAIIKDIAVYLNATLNKTKKGEEARRYIASRGLQVSARMGVWNSEVKAELLNKLPGLYNTTTEQIEKLIKRLFPTWVQDMAGKWHDYIDDYQLALPYTNGMGNVVGFVLRDIHNTPELEKRKYTYSKDMPRGGYCDALKGGVEPIILVEGILDAEAMKQNEFTNVIACGGQTPTDNSEDAAKSLVQTLLRYNAKKIIYIPDYEYKSVKDEAGRVVGVEEYPTADATRRTIKALLPYMTGKVEGDGFISIRIADLETADAKHNKAKMDADTYLRECGKYSMQQVLDDAAQWYEYELKAITQKHTNDVDTMTAEATAVYCNISNYAQRNRLKDEITAARSGYLAVLKQAGLNAEALAMIDKNGIYSTWATRMASVIGEMGKEKTAEGMAELLAKANRIQHADTYNAFAAQVNITREEMHKLVAAKPEYLQTSWALYKQKYCKATNETSTYEVRKISFAPAAVSIMAAPTNHGKTMVLLQTAINLAKTTSKKYIYLSFENDAEQLYIRAITAYMGDVWKAEQPNPRGEVRAVIKSADMPNDLFRTNGSSIDIDSYIRKYWAEVAPHLALVRSDADIDAVATNIEAQVAAWRNAGVEVGGIFIDYLQLLHYPAIHAHSRTDEVKGICDRLNDIAKSTRLPVIMAAQFNREATKAGGDKLDGIELANIGESAGIENIAEDVYLIWQVDKINPNNKDYYKGSEPAKGNDATFNIQPYQYRSRHCFANPKDKDSLRTGYLYVENLKARDFATGGYCLLKFNGAAGAIVSDESEY